MPWLGWALVVWVVVFWRLGFPSFWDPGDEAQYAQASREMLANGNWLVPTYNGRLFPDKPPLFYLLQILAYCALGPTEFAARLVPALSAVGLFVGVIWFERRLFGPRTGTLGALMLAVLPATFALSSYGILDMTFTAFVFTGFALLTVAALHARPRLQYGGYACVALAILTKGPLGLVLVALGMGLALVVTPVLRARVFRLRWVLGLSMIAIVTLPWFIYMWWQFGDAFVNGYAFRENVWLYTRGLSATAPAAGAPRLSYTRVLLVGLLPWTPVLIGRLCDLARGLRPSSEERLLWAWAGAVTLFFSFSHFKLDHYLYPVAPALCMLAAHAWRDLRAAPRLRPHLGTAIGVLLSGVTVAVSGLALVPLVRDVPVSMAPSIDLVPIVLLAAGGWTVVRLLRARLRPPALPLGGVAALLVTYSVVLVAVLPEFERVKPVKDLARWVATSVPADARVGAYRIDRWNTSWRFYVDRFVDELAGPDDFDGFMDDDQKLCVMMQQDFDELVAGGRPIEIVQERAGLRVTSGHALKRNGAANLKTFVVVGRKSAQPEHR
ncbi:MAG: glycosyltransferase family 39 protein [Vicinamibacterales bacterium]